MDRSNLLIGAGVLAGLGAVAYWLLNRSGDPTTSANPLTAQQRRLVAIAAQKRIYATWKPPED